MGEKKILIVDDVAANIQLLTTILKDRFSVVAAKTGQKALQMVQKQNPPDLVLLDIVMPEMSGYEVCKVIKQNQNTQDIPVIFISSMSDDQEKQKALSVGGDEYISKPVSVEELFEKIEKQLIKKKEKEMEKEIEKKRKILVVDDAPQNIQMVIEILKQEYNITAATNGEKALQILQDHNDIDLILLDIIMPGMDGYELCQRIKKDPKLFHIPVMFLTILENEQDILAGFEYGAVDYVTKPFEPAILKARVDTHIRLKVQEDSLKENIQQKDKLLIEQSKLATLGEMFESITHQWKQPLSVISMSNANIRIEQEMDTLSKESLIKMVDEIDNAIGHMSNTVDVFRDFLSNDVPKQYFNIKVIVDKTIQLLSSKLDNREIQITNNLQNIEILAHKNDLIQVLMNIFTNAIEVLEKKHDQKHIFINGKIEEKTFILQICDDGGGIAKENLEKIFHKYFTTKSEKKGSGIGLFISEKIVKDILDGSIEAYNQDDGACFELTLPFGN